MRIGRFEQADGGTLFLDEVGDMSPSTQAKILRVLQEQEFERLGGTRAIKVDVRIIAATNRNLGQMVAGRAVPQGPRLPAARRVDRHAAAASPQGRHPAARAALPAPVRGRDDKHLEGIGPDAVKVLMCHDWPGNIRELENVIERAVLLSEGPLVTVADLQIGESLAWTAEHDRTPAVRIPPSGISLEEIERQALLEALRMSNWVQKDAALLLGISPRVMSYKLKVLRIETPNGRQGTGESTAE